MVRSWLYPGTDNSTSLLDAALIEAFCQGVGEKIILAFVSGYLSNLNPNHERLNVFPLSIGTHRVCVRSLIFSLALLRGYSMLLSRF